MKKKLVLFLVISIVEIMNVIAQSPPAPAAPPGNLTGYAGPVQAPLEGGVSILIVMALAYALLYLPHQERSLEK
jgi:hypothetical protein